MYFLWQICYWKLKRLDWFLILWSVNSDKFSVHEVTHAHRGKAVSLATYHCTIETFQWTRPLSSWFCPSWRGATRDVLCKTITGGTSTAAGELILIEVVDHEVCLLWYSLHSFIDVFIYLWICWSNQQRIHFSPPREEPCHIYIFLIAHNSHSPGLTHPIKKMHHFDWHPSFPLKFPRMSPILTLYSPASVCVSTWSTVKRLDCIKLAINSDVHSVLWKHLLTSLYSFNRIRTTKRLLWTHHFRLFTADQQCNAINF